MRRFAMFAPLVLSAALLAGCGTDPAPICGALQSSDDPSALIGVVQDNAPGQDYPTALITAERQTRETCPEQVFKVDRIREIVGA